MPSPPEYLSYYQLPVDEHRKTRTSCTLRPFIHCAHSGTCASSWRCERHERPPLLPCHVVDE